MPPAMLSEEDKSFYEGLRATEEGPSMTQLLNKAFTPEKQAKVVDEIEFLVRNLKDDIGKKILASTNAKVIPNAVRDLISLLKSGINDLLANQINEILHNKEFQRLERSEERRVGKECA